MGSKVNSEYWAEKERKKTAAKKRVGKSTY